MDNSEEYRKKLELEILEVIEEKLKKGQMDAQRAKAIAKMVLDKLSPPLSIEQIHAIAPTLDDYFTELATAVLFVIEDHDEEMRRVVTEHAQKLIDSGKIEEAYVMIKKVTQLPEKL